jgi:putative oxidoreductase
MKIGSFLLLVGGIGTALASLLHVAIIVGGAPWYRFFGAGERMAQMATRGSLYPAVLTAIIALVLAVWSLYAWSGAGLLRPLPLLRPVLLVIAAIFTARGLLGIPVVLFARHPYAAELRARMPFMITTSLVCIVLAVCFAAGLVLTRPSAHD